MKFSRSSSVCSALNAFFSSLVMMYATSFSSHFLYASFISTFWLRGFSDGSIDGFAFLSGGCAHALPAISMIATSMSRREIVFGITATSSLSACKDRRVGNLGF
jgi:hypothetical protein